MQVWSLGQEDPLEEGMAAHSSIPARRIPWTEEPEGLQSTGLQRLGHKWSDLALTQVIWTPLSSVQFSHSVVSNSLQCHESQHARPPCPSPTPRVYPNPCPLSRWCHQAISSSVVLLLLPLIPPSIRVFSNESILRMRWPKYWSFSFSISPSNEHPGLISFRMDWLDLLAVQGTSKSILQHHSSKASIHRCSAFFTVQLSHPLVNQKRPRSKVDFFPPNSVVWLSNKFRRPNKCYVFIYFIF